MLALVSAIVGTSSLDHCWFEFMCFAANLTGNSFVSGTPLFEMVWVAAERGS